MRPPQAMILPRRLPPPSCATRAAPRQRPPSPSPTPAGARFAPGCFRSCRRRSVAAGRWRATLPTPAPPSNACCRAAAPMPASAPTSCCSISAPPGHGLPPRRHGGARRRPMPMRPPRPLRSMRSPSGIRSSVTRHWPNCPMPCLPGTVSSLPIPARALLPGSAPAATRPAPRPGLPTPSAMRRAPPARSPPFAPGSVSVSVPTRRCARCARRSSPWPAPMRRRWQAAPCRKSPPRRPMPPPPPPKPARCGATHCPA